MGNELAHWFCGQNILRMRRSPTVSVLLFHPGSCPLLINVIFTFRIISLHREILCDGVWESLWNTYVYHQGYWSETLLSADNHRDPHWGGGDRCNWTADAAVLSLRKYCQPHKQDRNHRRKGEDKRFRIYIQVQRGTACSLQGTMRVKCVLLLSLNYCYLQISPLLLKLFFTGEECAALSTLNRSVSPWGLLIKHHY